MSNNKQRGKRSGGKGGYRGKRNKSTANHKKQGNNKHGSGGGKNKVNQGMEIFNFGDPVPMLDKSRIFDFAECRWNGWYYETPYNLFHLAKSQHISPYHASSLEIKRNVLTAMFKPHKLLTRIEFMKMVQNFLVLGHGYLERHSSLAGNAIKLQNRPAKYVRRGEEEDEHVSLTTKKGWYTKHDIVPFTRGSVFQLSQPDINQEIYGVPGYLSALQSAWLGEAAVLYRRKYYMKGHSGYILYMTDSAHEEGDIKRMREAMKNSRGLDAFRNLFMYAPNGKKDGIQVIPLSDALTKDNFFDVNQVAMENVMAGHRVPGQLMAVIPKNTAGLGDSNTAMEVFMEMEIMPLQYILMQFNDWFGDEVISFREREVRTSAVET